MRIEIIPIEGIPLIKKGDNIAEIFLKSAQEELKDGDIVIVCHTVISKAKGYYYLMENGKYLRDMAGYNEEAYENNGANNNNDKDKYKDKEHDKEHDKDHDEGKDKDKGNDKDKDKGNDKDKDKGNDKDKDKGNDKD
ncbi:MAG: coenzyme F420-0:L-glutamate ligase, partial [Promethearchaeota archaeon]